jgi:hypothetical protein
VLFQLGIPNIFLELEQPEGIEEGALALPDRWLR